MLTRDRGSPRFTPCAAFVLAGIVLAGCGTAPPTVGTPAPSPAPGVLVVPGSSHVTGVYPATCRRAPGDDVRLPVRTCTPGSIRSDGVNPTDTQLAATICKPGWTATVRPPSSETDRLKTLAMAAYGVPAAQRSIVELDHLVPLELDGNNDVSNLWPEVSDEPGHGFRNTKDVVENNLKTAVCAHRITLTAAQVAIATNWTTAEPKLGIAPGADSKAAHAR